MLESGFYYHLLAKGSLKVEDEEPEIGALLFFVECFHELSSCRINTLALGPIPFTAVAEYFKIFKLEDFEEFLYFIRVMDSQLLRLDSDKSKARNKAGNKK